jgi:cytochrome c oxidase subunit 4
VSTLNERSESIAEELAEREHHSMVPYLVVWIALVILTFTTFTAARIDMGWFNLPVALVIASTKAGLVVWFFMHLRDHRGMNRIVFITALLFVLLLMGFSVGDVMTRFPLAVPPTHPSEVRGEGWEGGRRQPEGPRNEPVEPAPNR